MPFFDDLFAAADETLDGIFAGPATYRAAGIEISLASASIRSLGVDQDQDRDASTSWLGYVVELHASDLVVNGQAWEPSGGDEIAFPQSDGSLRVYKVVENRIGRSYEPLDTQQVKLLVFTKYIRTEGP